MLDILDPAEYREARPRVFASDGSLEWYMRRNRQTLVEAGALLLIAGRWRIHADKFDAHVLEAGARAALKNLNGRRS